MTTLYVITYLWSTEIDIALVARSGRTVAQHNCRSWREALDEIGPIIAMYQNFPSRLAVLVRCD